jgi:hypothetical protein
MTTHIAPEQRLRIPQLIQAQVYLLSLQLSFILRKAHYINWEVE